MDKKLKKYFSEMGKKSRARLTPEQRKLQAKKAIEARWKKYREAVDKTSQK
jgi:hypothetical protein